MSVSKVNHSGSSPVQGSETSSAKKTERASKAQGTRGAENSRATSAATAEISPRSRELASAKAVASDTPDVREAKIAELKRRIDSGKYKIDADAVADRMVNDDIQMFGN